MQNTKPKVNLNLDEKKDLLQRLQLDSAIRASVQKYANKIRHISPLLQRAKLQSYEEGLKDAVDGFLAANKEALNPSVPVVVPAVEEKEA